MYSRSLALRSHSSRALCHLGITESSLPFIYHSLHNFLGSHHLQLRLPSFRERHTTPKKSKHYRFSKEIDLHMSRIVTQSGKMPVRDGTAKPTILNILSSTKGNSLRFDSRCLKVLLLATLHLLRNGTAAKLKTGKETVRILCRSCVLKRMFLRRYFRTKRDNSN